MLWGAILGDIVGSVYEYERIKTKDFPLFDGRCRPTDDTFMTIAIALGVHNGGGAKNYADEMRRIGRLYPDAGYGVQFGEWLSDDDMHAHNSFGNGAAMRVSPVAYFPNADLARVRYEAEQSAIPTHNHPEGVKGAVATATAVFLARQGRTKREIRDFIEEEYGYDLDRTLEQIRPNYEFKETCQETVPQAIIAFLEGDNFEDAIRNAVSLGGDSDTLATIAGSIAEPFYGIPEYIIKRAREFLDDKILGVIDKLEANSNDR